MLKERKPEYNIRVQYRNMTSWKYGVYKIITTVNLWNSSNFKRARCSNLKDY